jgi:predicted nucleic acid-binding protein
VVCAVCDAGPLIHLDELGCPSLLEEFDRLLVPSSVWEEVLKHRRSMVLQGCEFPPIRPASQIWEETFRSLALHRGEIDALRLVANCPASLLLTDDTAARLAAERLGVPAVGTLGILIRSIRRKLKTKNEVLELLRQIPSRSSLHVNPDLLAKVLAKVENEG